MATVISYRVELEEMFRRKPNSVVEEFNEVFHKATLRGALVRVTELMAIVEHAQVIVDGASIWVYEGDDSRPVQCYLYNPDRHDWF